MNIDEGWWRSGQRDESGNFIVDTTQWPGGMQAIARYIHGKGLKAGIYIDAGPRGCGKRADGTHFVGSDFAYYDHDFLQFAQWRFDFVKVDFCGGMAKNYDPETTYRSIAQAIRRERSDWWGQAVVRTVESLAEKPGYHLAKSCRRRPSRTRVRTC
nr:alpha-galactosidase [Paraburkholderia terrae]